MSAPPSPLALLGVAEELSTAGAHLGDPATEAQLRHLLDRVVDAVVDVTQGRDAPSRNLPVPDPPPDGALPAPATGPADLGTADAASCSALASRCHRAAAHLDAVGSQPLAEQVARCLRQLANGLQDLVQDLPHEQPPVMRQRFLRSLRRATALLDGQSS
ncbi:hypothetical protein NF556_13830 [Ornithinimicrobium faecis]|uniref:Uncharacterized protein n=1 Tax=Ornithinimicrobium faecis TaxID=2934158 RepID=A0ABY4YRB8_9MICO|nr:hypothetical protein [Ornithinimicrobium sp. HY1793]USQ78702.1 hypothetical protein NF556_13830 [Ornithinimicrobium sp. HY1793]